MSPSDKKVIFIAAIFCLLHFFVWAVGLTTGELPVYTAVLNGLCGVAVVTYWVQKQLRITQHIFELREMVFLVAECAVTGISVYALLSHSSPYWTRITGYVVFGIHLLAGVLFFVFMRVFRIRRLF